MMGRRLSLLVALWLVLCGIALADAPPQDTYLQIYFTIQEADRLEHNGQYASARAKFQDASDALDALKKNHPEWESSMVNFRIKYVRDKLSVLADKQDTNAPKPGDASVPIPAPAPTPAPSPAAGATDATALQQRISALESELADTKKKLADALSQAASLRQRLDAAERALAGVKGANLEERVASLLDENNSLKTQLNDAQQKVKDLQANGADSSLTQLRDQLKAVNQQVATLEAENQAFRANTNDLKAQLESALAKLDQADKQASQLGSSADTSKRENEVLRGILTRQLQEQARRDEAKRLASDEIANLKIQSKVLQQQIDVLGSPIVTLSPEERALLHLTAPTPSSPGIASSPTGGTTMQAYKDPSKDNAAALGGGQQPAPSPAQSAPAPAADNAAAAATPSGADKPRVPEEVRPLAKLAADYFAQGKLDQAADCYDKIIQKYPDSLYAWSNLGVVRFQQQRYPEAEKALLQATKLNPNDAFSLSILGVVFYQENRYDDAIDALTKATALSPDDARTWNYLGISYSQKGWQDAAEKALRKAVDIDPTLGDAQFNLAVIYATQKPPSRELAKKHYQAALDQGIPKDPQLEKFFSAPADGAPSASNPASAPASTNAPAAAPAPAKP